MKHLTNLPIGGRYVAIDMSGYFCPCMLNYCDSVSQYLSIIATSSFEYRNPQEMDDTVLYAEPTLQGNAAICKRQEGEQETQMNLELLFNAVINGKLND